MILQRIPVLSAIYLIFACVPQCISNQTTKALPDACPQSQDEFRVLQEIQIPGSGPMTVACVSRREIGPGWMVVYYKDHFSPEFNSTFEEHERGFGVVGGMFDESFFMGFKRLHLLMNGKPHEVIISTTIEKQRCDNVVIGDRSEGYMLKTVGNCTKPIELGLRQGAKFSTLERDEDGNPNHNWAKEVEFNWWFDSQTDLPYFEINYYYTYISIMIRRKD